MTKAAWGMNMALMYCYGVLASCPAFSSFSKGDLFLAMDAVLLIYPFSVPYIIYRHLARSCKSRDSLGFGLASSGV